jgi:hypothetical protein
MPQLILALTSIVALPELTPVRVPITVPAPVLQTAEAPKNVDWTVTSAFDELTVPFVPEVQATDRLPLARTLVVWAHFSKGPANRRTAEVPTGVFFGHSLGSGDRACIGRSAEFVY